MVAVGVSDTAASDFFSCIVPDDSYLFMVTDFDSLSNHRYWMLLVILCAQVEQC